MVVIIVCFLFFVLLIAFLSNVLLTKKTTVIDVLSVDSDVDQDYLQGYFESINTRISCQYRIATHETE